MTYPFLPRGIYNALPERSTLTTQLTRTHCVGPLDCRTDVRTCLLLLFILFRANAALGHDAYAVRTGGHCWFCPLGRTFPFTTRVDAPRSYRIRLLTAA